MANEVHGIIQSRMVEQIATRSSPRLETGSPHVSIVIPCLNEAQTIERCVQAAQDVLQANGIDGEVIVADNGSDDGSDRLAAAGGARVVKEPRRGYGSAYQAGFAAARGTYIVMLDADLTYDFADIPRFLAELDKGAQFVIGNRMENIRPGAMPWLHRYIGNPLLTGILNLFFRTGIRDAHCGMRAFRSDVLPALDLRTTGMEFASEMVIRVSREHLRVSQLPIEYHPREGESKLSSFRDGWRHLRFLLVHSPTHLFVIPGAALTVLGALIMVMVLAQVSILGRFWDVHTMIGGALLAIVGTQILALGLCARAYGVYVMGLPDRLFERWRPHIKLEHGLLAGAGLLLVGLAVGGVILGKWLAQGRGALAETNLALLGATFVIVGIQTFFSSFLLSIIGLRRDGLGTQSD